MKLVANSNIQSLKTARKFNATQISHYLKKSPNTIYQSRINYESYDDEREQNEI
jgi:hypothetical protein